MCLDVEHQLALRHFNLALSPMLCCAQAVLGTLGVRAEYTTTNHIMEVQQFLGIGEWNWLAGGTEWYPWLGAGWRNHCRCCLQQGALGCGAGAMPVVLSRRMATHKLMPAAVAHLARL